MLPVSGQDEWDKGYGTVLDSGTTFTYFTRNVFNLVSATIKHHVLERGLKMTPGPDPKYSDICWAGGPLNPAELRRYFPGMSFTLEDGFELHLEPINYLFIHAHLPGGYCLGVFENGSSGTLLGGITFRNILVEVNIRQIRQPVIICLPEPSVCKVSSVFFILLLIPSICILQYDRAARQVGFAHAPCRAIGQGVRPTVPSSPAESTCPAAARPAPLSLSQARVSPAFPLTHSDLLGIALATFAGLLATPWHTSRRADRKERGLFLSGAKEFIAMQHHSA